MEPDEYKVVSWELRHDYADLINNILEKHDTKKKFDPDTVTADQEIRHAETPALQRAWDDYITLWKLTHD